MYISNINDEFTINNQNSKLDRLRHFRICIGKTIHDDIYNLLVINQSFKQKVFLILLNKYTNIRHNVDYEHFYQFPIDFSSFIQSNSLAHTQSKFNGFIVKTIFSLKLFNTNRKLRKLL